MARIQYEEHNFRTTRVKERIILANRILEEYAEMGMPMTLRQLHYQMVSRGMVENTFSNYQALIRTLTRARRAGLIDWNHLVDRTRYLRGTRHWSDPREALKEAAERFRIDKWEGQKYLVECWIEKEALIGVIEGACKDLDINFFACKGNPSESEMWRAGQRLLCAIEERGMSPIILYAGDHDPTGIDIPRDIGERLSMFTDGRVEVIRIALNMSQVEEYSPPPNFIKERDSRTKTYRSMFGTEECWELDALSPEVMMGVIRDTTLEYRDEEIWESKVEEEQSHLERLGRWPELDEMVEGLEEDLKIITDDLSLARDEALNHRRNAESIHKNLVKSVEKRDTLTYQLKILKKAWPKDHTMP